MLYFINKLQTLFLKLWVLSYNTFSANVVAWFPSPNLNFLPAGQNLFIWHLSANMRFFVTVIIFWSRQKLISLKLINSSEEPNGHVTVNYSFSPIKILLDWNNVFWVCQFWFTLLLSYMHDYISKMAKFCL